MCMQYHDLRGEYVWVHDVNGRVFAHSNKYTF